jgi:tetratricopeptide (TPR) repeat protein
MKRFPLLIILLTLAACGGSGQKFVVENPYAERMKELSRNGVAAMQRERWLVAEKLFDRALQTAQLANDPDLVARAWYNLGMLHVSAGDVDKGEGVLKRALSVADQHHLKVTAMRAGIALALLYQRQQKEAWKPDVLSASFPADIHLSAARLAQLQERYDVARREYAFVLRRKDVNRSMLLYKMEAHMGMALMAEQQHDHKTAKKEVARVLQKSREVGAPRLAAHALLFSARLDDNQARQQEQLQDALAIYQALKDIRGQRDTLQQLIRIAEQKGDREWKNELDRQLLTVKEGASE